MKTRIFILLLFVWIGATSSIRAAVGTQPPGSGGSLSITGSVSPVTPLSFTPGTTSLVLEASIASLATNQVMSYATNRNLLPSLTTNVVYVNATGTTAVINGTLYTNALKAATAGSTLIMSPGTYGIPQSSMPLLRNGINQYWNQGSKLWVGTTNTAYTSMFSDEGEVVVCSIMGYGKFYGSNEISIPIYLDKTGTKVEFECDIIDADGNPGETSTAFLLGSGAPELSLTVRDYMNSSVYDAFYFSPSTGTKLRLKASKVFAKGDIMEMTDDSPAWGNVIIDIDYAEQVGIGQPTFLQAAGRVDIRVGRMKVNYVGACMTFYGTTNAYIHDTVIEVPVNSTNSVIDQGFTMNGTHCGAWLKNVTIYGSTNRPIFNLTNVSAVPLVLENVTLHSGFGASTWVSAPASVSGATVRIEGSGVSLVPYRSIGANISFSGMTNVVAGLLVRGGQTNAGQIMVAGLVTAFNGLDSYGDININNGASLNVDGVAAFSDEVNLASGLFFNNLTPSRVMFVNPNGHATNVTSASPTTEFVRADGVAAVPPGGSNFLTAAVTNVFLLGTTNTGSNAVQVFDMTGPSIADAHVNGDTTFVLTNVPAWTNVGSASPTYRMIVRYTTGTLTLTGLHPIDFGRTGLFLTQGATNDIAIQYVNGRLRGWVGQQAYATSITMGSSASAVSAGNAYFFGANFNQGLDSSLSALRQIRAPRAGTVRECWIEIQSTHATDYGSANALSVRLTNGTQSTSSLIGTLSVSNQTRIFYTANAGLAVNSNDTVAGMIIMPASFTNNPGSGWQIIGGFTLE